MSRSTDIQDAMGVTERDREFAAQILEDFSSFEEGIENQEKLAQWIRNVRHNAASVPDAAATPSMREALGFYADPTRYNGPNSRLQGEPDKYQPTNLYYRLDVTRDGGQIARKALAGDAAQGWRDISTAPKDGTLILICGFSPEYFVADVKWNDGWMLFDVGADGWTEPCFAATHWQPMLAPPVSSTQIEADK